MIYTNSTRKRVTTMLLLMLCFALLFSTFTFAAYADGEPPAAGGSDEITNGIRTGLEKIYNILISIALPIAVIGLVGCGIAMIALGDKATEGAKKTLVRVIIALAIIILAPLIVKEVAGWFGNHAISDVYDAIG